MATLTAVGSSSVTSRCDKSKFSTSSCERRTSPNGYRPSRATIPVFRPSLARAIPLLAAIPPGHNAKPWA
ncbi:MAG: hypothetical protein BWY92_01656 [Firmicutes bacterium ADurb.BinA052]|nr:MAG: hypothetical protein BWY92_01656 [Firmicutes bacterium ADurb.BinA052]